MAVSKNAKSLGAKSFRAKLTGEGPRGAWVFVKVPFDVQKTFGTRARLAVRGTINGFAFRSSIFPDGKGCHNMMVNKAMQTGAGAAAGDTVAVTMAPDTAPRTVTVPKDLKAALARSRPARGLFEKLAYSHRKEFVDWIEQAKKPETRSSRVEKTVTMMLEGRRVKGQGPRLKE
jgi:hypothetical protein